MNTRRQLGKQTSISRHTPTRITWSRSVRWCLAVGLACGDQRKLTGSGSALEELRDDALYQTTYFTFFYFKRVKSNRQINPSVLLVFAPELDLRFILLARSNNRVTLGRNTHKTIFVVHRRRSCWTVLGTLSTLEALFLRRCAYINWHLHLHSNIICRCSRLSQQLQIR